MTAFAEFFLATRDPQGEILQTVSRPPGLSNAIFLVVVKFDILRFHRIFTEFDDIQ